MLDLVLADVNDMMKIYVLPNLADHCVVCIDLNVVIGTTATILRDVSDFLGADWDGSKAVLKECCWGEF